VRALFVSPHPDDTALSCGGHVLRLARQGDDVTIVTVFSGSGPDDRLTPYQRLALGFGSQDRGEGGARGDSAATRTAGDGSGSIGADGAGSERAPTPYEVMSRRREEDRAYARIAGATVVQLNLPDAVFRGYVGDEQLLGEPEGDDPAPVRELRVIVRDLAPDRLYVPLAVGGHVDHRLVRRAGMALLETAMDPAAVRFYEDFPYAQNLDFRDVASLDAEFAAALPGSWLARAEIVPISDVLERKVDALGAYASQLGRLFGGRDPMARAVVERAEAIGRQSGNGASERYWRLARG
jgi:LmbE family N-acetylglucosaminyl deacetylase